MLTFTRLASGLALALFTLASHAQGYPSKPLRIIVPFAPGGSTHIPYKGSSQAMTDLLGGQIRMMFENLPGAASQIRSGKIRGIAVTSLRRSPAFPELPAVSETLPGFEVVAWFGLFAPAGTPAPIIARLNAESDKALRLAEVREKIIAAGSDPIGGTPEDMARFLANDIAKWTRVTREAGIKPQ